jgi:serine/threonine protein kinase
MQTLKEGDKFERYHILHTVGNGTAGISYEAEDRRQNRTVILKFLHTAGPLPDAVRRQFFREIQTISSLKHPQIAPILNYGEWHQQLFVVRAFNPYGSLLNGKENVRLHLPLDINVAIAYGIQIAKILNYIHKSGYAHGSLTFANILIEQESAENQKTLPLLIADIGLATFVQSQGYISTSHLPITAAPEQLKGQTLPASDQYALATILYFLLVNRSPFAGSPEELGRLKTQETIQSIAPLNTHVSRELENILRRALSAHPKNRYASIHEFIHAVAKAPKKQLYATLPERTFVKKSQPVPEAETKDTRTDTKQSIPVTNVHLVITLQASTETSTYQITLDETSIGRAGSSDVLLEKDENVSRHHALIRRENNQCAIYDNRSMDGVSVNGQKLPPETAHILADSDKILIGKYTLLFHDTLPVQQEIEQQEHVTF